MARIFGILIAVLFLCGGSHSISTRQRTFEESTGWRCGGAVRSGSCLPRWAMVSSKTSVKSVKWYALSSRPRTIPVAQYQSWAAPTYHGDGVEQDYAEAVRLWRLAAEQGYALAQNNLGYAYYNGDGVKQDYAEAVRWYRLAAEQGDADAQNNLGIAYASGKGVEQDYAEAVRWYRLAAEQGYALAQYNLGIAYAAARC